MIYFWIRKQVRKFMSPIHQRTAEDWSKRLTGIYVLSAWAACGLMIYEYKKTREKLRMEDPAFAIKEKMPGIYYGRVLRAEKMHMYSYEDGKFQKTGVYEVEKDTLLKRSDIDFFGEEIVKEKVADDFE